MTTREVVVVGAGFGGVVAAATLAARGFDVDVIEAGDGIGGTWRDAAYPGAGCDVPGALYCYSFAPNPDWTRHYPVREEILAYLRGVADDLGVTPLVRCGVRLLRADWDEDARRWLLQTSAGPLRARWVVAATGALHHPVVPDLPGLDDFAGRVVHTGRWDPGLDLRGRRVAVIGAGASALQVVPEIAPQAARLVLLARTPQWVLPKYDRGIGARERRLLRRVPALQRLVRWGAHLGSEALALAAGRPALLAPLAWLGRRNLRRQVTDPALRERLRPVDRIGCRRILISNDWYPTLARPDVVVADGDVRAVHPHAVVDGAGTEHAVDTIVLATGYQVAEPPSARWFHDADGVSMAERFAASGARAHLGTTVPGFPNLFLLAGPNSIVYSSLITVLEAQAEHAARALETARARGVDRVEVGARAEQRFHDRLTRRLAGTVWATGCRSWYLDRQGRNTTTWPGTTVELCRRLRRFRPEDHRFAARTGERLRPGA